MTKLSVSYEDGLSEDLRDPEEAAAYLDAAIEEGSQEAFLLALRDVAEAHGIGSLARAAMLNRENLYRILSDRGNPQLASLIALLDALGMRLGVQKKHSSAAA